MGDRDTNAEIDFLARVIAALINEMRKERPSAERIKAAVASAKRESRHLDDIGRIILDRLAHQSEAERQRKAETPSAQQSGEHPDDK